MLKKMYLTWLYVVSLALVVEMIRVWSLAWDKVLKDPVLSLF